MGSERALSDQDLDVLARIVGRDTDELRSELRRKPWRLHELLSSPGTAEAVLEGKVADADLVTPFVFFAVLVHRSADDLSGAEWVGDWSGPRVRLPVFDVDTLVEFAVEPARLLFLARLLASFAAPRPAIAPVGSLDLAGMVEWLDMVEAGHGRAELLGQLGDLALFLAGVCADNTGPQVLTPLQAERLGRSVDMSADQLLELVDPASLSPGLDALETLGSRWYEAAARHAPGGGIMRLDIARHIRSARRFLNQVADRYLTPISVDLEVA